MMPGYRLIALLIIFLTCPVRGQKLDTCWTSSLIPDSIFLRMKGKSYGASCTIPRSELRYLKLSYKDKLGKTQSGEMVCNKAIASDIIDIFRQLWLADYRIECMRLIDDFDAVDEKSMQANNTSCFNFRKVSGSNTISKHGKGMAVDVNPLYNPCVRSSRVEPKTGKKWAYRRSTRNDIPMKIDHNDLCYRLFKAHGFKWGGDWRSLKDYQHFEK